MTQNVFLTGATGALGPILAAELLASGAAPRLRVLIRSGDSPAIVRFNQWIGTLESFRRTSVFGLDVARETYYALRSTTMLFKRNRHFQCLCACRPRKTAILPRSIGQAT